MPLYFAYGANMNVAAMAARCPRSKPLGLAKLVRHRLVVWHAPMVAPGQREAEAKSIDDRHR